MKWQDVKPGMVIDSNTTKGLILEINLEGNGLLPQACIHYFSLDTCMYGSSWQCVHLKENVSEIKGVGREKILRQIKEQLEKYHTQTILDLEILELLYW